MKIKDILKVIEGEVITEFDFEGDIKHGLTSDLMSDVLTLEVEDAILITGLNNLQTIRTAEMSDIHCVIIGRGKQVSEDIIKLANQNKITIIESAFTVFKISGILYENGVRPIY